MNDRQWIIGCDRDVDVLVHESVVSRRHCRLSLHGSLYFIEDLASRNGTFVGDKRVVTRTAIEPGTKVMLADSVLMPWADESLAKEKFEIGRADSNDIVIDDASVSSHHAILFRDPNDVWIVRDLNSTNGTSLGDSEPIASAARVTNEDVIRFGSVAETLSSLRRNVNPNTSTRQSKSDSASGPKLRRPTKDTDAKGIPTIPVRGIGDTTAVRKTNWMDNAIGMWKSLPTGVSYSLAAAFVLIALFGVWGMMTKGDSATPREALADGDPNTTAEDPTTALTATNIDADAIAGTTPPPVTTDPADNHPPAAAVNSQSEVAASPAKETSFESAIRSCLYQVIATSEGNRFGLGMALAIDSDRLLTTGNVVENLQRLEATIRPACRHLTSNEAIALQETAMHPKWTESRRTEQQCIDWLKYYQSQVSELAGDEGVETEEMLQQRDEVYRSAMVSRTLARAYDVGVIRTTEPLPQHLAALESKATGQKSTGAVSALEWIATPAKPPRPMAIHRLIGEFVQNEDPFLPPDSESSITKKQVQPLFLLPRLSTDMPPIYVGRMRGAADSGMDYSGGVILDGRGRLAGLFSTPAELDQQQKKRVASLVADRDLIFDWILMDVLSELMARPSLPWVANQTETTGTP